MLRTPFHALVVSIPLLATTTALAHDIWISRGSYKNPAGEWCCGATDCGVVSSNAVKPVNGGYSLRGDGVYG